MISILIPVFNVDVLKLVYTLHQQLQDLKLDGEILIYDDFSKAEFKNINKEISSLSNVTYKELNQNIGRVEIRKKLANDARFNWLLFLDCDSEVIKDDFLQTYIAFISKDFDLVTGGTQYQSTEPECNKRLHWKYGKEREVVTKNKQSFRTNNFCIKKGIYQTLQFPKNISGYGHEDTWIGIALNKVNAKIAFTDNPVLHNGLEDADTFILKSLNSLKNLKYLSKIVDENVLRKHVTLFNVYQKSRSILAQKTILFIYSISKKSIHKNLISCNPSLKLFDFYRLANFILLMRRRED